VAPSRSLISFHVPGPSRAWSRPRLSGTGRRTRFYTDPKDDAYRHLVAWHAKQAWRERYGKPLVPLDMPLGLRVDVMRARPQRPQRPVPAGTPDCDNYVKAVNDALNGVLWKDDALVCDLEASKRYADNDEEIGLIVTVWQLEL